MTKPSFNDLEKISSYLDGQLNERETRRFAQRLEADPNLRAALDDLRRMRAVLRDMPKRRAPRNFTLNYKMAGLRPPVPRAFPVLRLASVVAMFLFVVVFTADIFSSQTPLAAPAPFAAERSVEMGAPGEQPPMAAAPDLQNVLPSELPQGFGGSGPDETPDGQTAKSFPEETMVPNGMGGGIESAQDHSVYQPVRLAPGTLRNAELLFLLLAVFAGGGAFYLHYSAENSWRKQNPDVPRLRTPRKITSIAILIVASLLVIGIAIGLYLAQTGLSSSGTGISPAVSMVEDPFSVDIFPGNPVNLAFIQSEHQSVMVDFPADAFSEAGNLMYVPGLAASPSPDLVFSGHAFILQPAPKSLALKSRGTVTIKYSDSDLQGYNEANLFLFWWTGDRWQDAALTCMPASTYTIDRENNLIQLPICSLGAFGLFVFVP